MACPRAESLRGKLGHHTSTYIPPGNPYPYSSCPKTLQSSTYPDIFEGPVETMESGFSDVYDRGRAMPALVEVQTRLGW
jgi:hypothetical protein